MPRKPLIFLTSLIVGLAVVGSLIWYVRADPFSAEDSFNNPEKIATKTSVTVVGGQLKLAEETWSTLTEGNCNSIDGWYWYATNGRGACWSKTLADTVSWNKGVGDDVDNPGAYTCASDVPALKDRMIAASAGEWYKLVSSVNSVTITAAHNGSAGYSSISALAIADCLDGTRDLCTGDGCLGIDLAATNASLFAWALTTGGKSALPYCSESGCASAATSDFRNACEQHSSHDYPLACYLGLFYTNTKTCGDGDLNYIWAAVAGNTPYARVLGYSSCAVVGGNATSVAGTGDGVRVVVRP